MMKRLFIFLFASVLTSSIYADDYGFLTFEQQNGQKTSLAVSDMVITFVDGKAQATVGENTYDFTLADLTKMYFSVEDITTSIGTPPNLPQWGETQTTGIYDLQGRKITDIPSSRKGFYIVRRNGQTYKTVIK